MNGLVKKFFEFAIGNGIVIILGIVTTFIGTRLIQPLESGKTDTFISYSGLIVLLVTMGIDQAFIRYYNDEKEENRGSNQFLNWLLQMFTEHLHLYGFKSLHSQKRPHPLGCGLFWRSERDLNPRALFRRLLP